MHTVALHTDQTTKTYSMTVRDLERSPHWQITNQFSSESGWNPQIIRDTREDNIKGFTVLGQFGTERQAREFANVIAAAYTANGYVREMVKVSEDPGLDFMLREVNRHVPVLDHEEGIY